MIYKLSLNEDTYSNNTIRDLTRMIRSSLSGYVEKVSDISNTDLGFAFKAVWDSAENQEAFIEITDEHDIIGLTPIEFNLYIDEDEFGPFCYHNSEKACKDAKDRILDSLHDKFNDVSELADTEQETIYSTSDNHSKLDNSVKNQHVAVPADGEDEIIYIVCFDEDGQNMDYDFTDKAEARAYALKYIEYGPVLYEVDLDGNLLDTEYIGDLKESILTESTSLDSFLKSKIITVDSVTGIDPNCMKRSLMPRGCYFKSSSLLGARVVDHGTIHWQGTDYVFRVKSDGSVVTMTDAQAGSNWSETIFKEATLADYTVGDPDNQRYIGNAQIIKVSDLPKIGEKFKAGIATAINKIGYEEGYMIYEVWVTEPGSLEGFAEFEYDTARWLFAIKNFNEALERDNANEEDLNEFAYKIDDLKQFYNTSTGIDKEKYPNFFAWYDAMTKEGKFKNSQITA